MNLGIKSFRRRCIISHHMGKHLNPRRLMDKIGFRSGKLLVTQKIESSKGAANEGGLWKCQCECGNTKIVKGYNLRSGNKAPHSCGCATGEDIARGAYKRRKYRDSTISMQYYTHTYAAKVHDWSPLTKEIWLSIVFSPCAYCGGFDVRNRAKRQAEKVKYVKLTPEELAQYDVLMNGVDRIDSSLPYSPENSVSCCEMCNMMKRHHSVADFIEHVNKIYHHRSNTSPEEVVQISLIE